jgi:hypothetical protein
LIFAAYFIVIEETNPAKENDNADAFGKSSTKMGW